MRLFFLLLGFVLLLGCRPATSADKPLVFGVFPNLTAKQIVEVYRPMAKVLEKQVNRRVDIFSARDFKTFVARGSYWSSRGLHPSNGIPGGSSHSAWINPI